MSNDLYSGLISPYLRKGKNGEQFWGLYDPLDSVNVPDSSLFLKIQIDNLKTLEGSERYDAVNNFLKQVQGLQSQHEAVAEDTISNEIYERIIELFNAGLRGSPLNPYKYTKSKTQAIEKGKELAEEMSNLLAQVGASETISKEMVKTLNKRIANFNWNSFPNQYIMEKADLIEALMVDKINQDSALRAIVTGAWTDMSGQQLIEDGFAFAKDGIDLPFEFGKLKFYVKTKKGTVEKSAKSIKDFLDQVDNIKSKKFTVKLSDELYSALRDGSVIAAQAKSGMRGQAILNINKRNAITLGEIEFDPQQLWELYQADMQTRTQFFKPEEQQDSKSLEALANYCLSKNIAKTALKFNQLYLTSEGFVSASQWMEQTHRYLIFNPAIRSIGGDFLTRSRPYAFN